MSPPKDLQCLSMGAVCRFDFRQGVLNLFYMKKVYIRSLGMTVIARKIDGGSWQSISFAAIWPKEDVIELYSIYSI